MTPVNLSGTAMPNPPQRSANQKLASDNDVWSQKLNFLHAKKPLQIQFEKKKILPSCVFCWIWIWILHKKSWVFGFKQHYTLSVLRIFVHFHFSGIKVIKKISQSMQLNFFCEIETYTCRLLSFDGKFEFNNKKL